MWVFKRDHSCIHIQLLNCFLRLAQPYHWGSVSKPALLFSQHTSLAALGSVPTGPITLFKELLLDRWGETTKVKAPVVLRLKFACVALIHLATSTTKQAKV